MDKRILEDKLKKDQMTVIHTGDEYGRYLNAVVPPVFMNSLHVFDSIEDYYGVDVFSDDSFYYGRDGNPTVHILERKMAGLEHGCRGVVFSSGMAAFTAAMKSGWKECPEIPHAQTLSMMQMMDFIRRQLGISYEDIQISQIPNMIEGTSAAQPFVQEMVTAAQPPVQETVSVEAEQEPESAPESSAGEDIPETAFEEAAEEIPTEEKE